MPFSFHVSSSGWLFKLINVASYFLAWTINPMARGNSTHLSSKTKTKKDSTVKPELIELKLCTLQGNTTVHYWWLASMKSKVFSPAICPGFGVWGTPGSSWQGHAWVKNLPRMGWEVCTTFGRDWSGGSSLKEGYRYKQSLLCILANRAPALPGKNLMSLCHPSGHFTLHKVLSPVTQLDFGVSWGGIGGVMLVLRSFPILVGRPVQNWVRIGPAVRAWKGYTGTNSPFIYIDGFIGEIGRSSWEGILIFGHIFKAESIYNHNYKGRATTSMAKKLQRFERGSNADGIA